jgi:hypothetical protein
VFDLRSLFAEAHAWPPRGGKLLFIVGTGEDAGALIAEGLPYRQRLQDESPDQPPGNLPAVLSQRLSAAYERNGTWWLDCDLSALLRDLGTRTDANITTSGGAEA